MGQSSLTVVAPGSGRAKPSPYLLASPGRSSLPAWHQLAHSQPVSSTGRGARHKEPIAWLGHAMASARLKGLTFAHFVPSLGDREGRQSKTSTPLPQSEFAVVHFIHCLYLDNCWVLVKILGSQTHRVLYISTPMIIHPRAQTRVWYSLFAALQSPVYYVPGPGAETNAVCPDSQAHKQCSEHPQQSPPAVPWQGALPSPLGG